MPTVAVLLPFLIAYAVLLILLSRWLFRRLRRALLAGVLIMLAVNGVTLVVFGPMWWSLPHGVGESAVPWFMAWVNVVTIPFVAVTLVFCRLYASTAAASSYPRCGQCGYNLTGNVSGICPECGEAVPQQRREQGG